MTLKLVATVDGVEVPWADLKALSTGDLMDDDGLVTLTGKIDESATFDNLPKMCISKVRKWRFTWHGNLMDDDATDSAR